MFRLRQVVTVARDLRTVEAQLCAELGLEVCYRDPGLQHFGLRHGLYSVGDQLIEVVSPRRSDTTAGRFLDRRNGDGGYMIIFQVDDLDAHRSRLADAQIRIVHEGGVPGITGLHLHPGDVGGAIVSIDQADPPEQWPWAGTDWAYHAASDQTSIVGVEVQADDPAAMAQRWSVATGIELSAELTLTVDDATIRFVPAADGRGDGVSAFDLVTKDPDRAGLSLDIGGVHWNLTS